ncbi:MAG: urease accessory protein UreD [Anaerolineae bacterium]|nr:urease accessory protein UreD [Anaerolineae bacterium]
MLIDAPDLSTSSVDQPGLKHHAARHGELRLGFARRGNQTVMHHSFFRTPLQVMRAITDDAGCARVYMLSPTGGVVQGDRYQIEVTVEENAHALVTTLAASKIYRMDRDRAVQRVKIEVMPGAILEYVPDASILFAGSYFEQHVEIFLHPGAFLMFQDSVMPGRLASGECLNFTRYINRLIVRDAQGLLLYEMQDLMPQVQDLNQVGVLEGYRCWASWFLLGDLDRFNLDAAAFCEAQSDALSNHPTLLGSASRLYRNGICVRLLAPFWSSLAEVLTRLWRDVRIDYMGLPAASLRK